LKSSKECINPKASRLNSKSTNIILLVLSQAINLILLFLFTPYLVRALPQEEYGTYSQVLLIADFIGILVSIAVVQIAMMAFTKPNYPFEDSLKTLLIFSGISALAGMLLMFVSSLFAGHLFNNPAITPLLILFAPFLLGLKLNNVLNQALIRLNQSKFILFLSVSTNLTKLLLAFIAVHYYHSLVGMMVVYSLEPLISSLIQLWKLFKMGHLNGKFNRHIFREMAVLAFPLYIVELLGASYTYMSGFVISINLNEEAYAVYKNGSFEIPVIGTLYGTISTVFMGDMSMLIHDGNHLTLANIKRKIMTTTAVILFPFAIYFIFFSEEFILFYYSSKYADSIPVFMIFTAALLIRVQNYTDVLILLRKSKFVLISFVIFVLANLVLNILLSKWYGVMGCALGTIVSVYLLAFIQVYFTVRELGVRVSDYVDWKKLILIVLISAVFIAAVKILFGFLIAPLWIVLSSSISLTVPVLIILFIKLRFMDIEPMRVIFEKIPFFGKRFYQLLK
jgi:O-antigen/teichoic acid export membrane protein